MGLAQSARVDLHRHLEGCARLETLLLVAKEYKISIPSEDPNVLALYYKITNDPPGFLNFLSKFNWVSNYYINKEVIERVAYEAVEDAAKEAITHLELRFSPAHFARRERFPLDKVTEWITTSALKSARKNSIHLSFLATFARHLPMEINRPAFDVVMEMKNLFTGVDLAGDELNHFGSIYIPLFVQAKEAGLGITIHAGEGGPPENIIRSIKEFKADRIGHGTRVVESKEAMNTVLKNNVTLEMCLTSNLHTNTIKDIKKHPIKFLVDEGFRVTLNTDNPQISSTTLPKEFDLAQKELGLNGKYLDTLTSNAISALFSRTTVCK